MSSRMPSATVNGLPLGLEGVTSATNALDWLRSCGLTGEKEGCAEGECGACAVLVAGPGTADRGDGEGSPTSEWTAINACLVPAASLDGQEIVTVEGLGSPDDLHPVQRELALRGGSQCGYCTPGFVCSLAAEYYRADRTSPGCDPHALSGLRRALAPTDRGFSSRPRSATCWLDGRCPQSDVRPGWPVRRRRAWVAGKPVKI